MARQYRMSYEGHPANRWVKMYKGIRYRVTCQELGAMVFTQEGSWKLANAWWDAKQAEIDGPTTLQRVLDAVDAIPVEKLDEMRRRGDAVAFIREQLPTLRKVFEAEKVVGPIAGILGDRVGDDEEADAIADAVAPALTARATKKEMTFKVNADRFLSVIQGESKPLTFREIRYYVASMVAAFGPDADVSVLDESAVEAIFLALKKADLSQGVKKKRWGFFTRFVSYLGEKGVIPVPRNLHSKSLRFTVPTRKVVVYDTAEVRAVLAGMTDRQRLYAMLGLNCGMTSADIGQLTRDMIQGDKLTRRRSKTGAVESTPTVTYTLWPETTALLASCGSSHPTLVLTGRTGEALWESRLEADGSTPQKDMISQQWKRAKISIPHKAFRSISATCLATHREYGKHVGYFLGHSPKSMADKHYAAPSDALFAEVLAWLREKMLGR